MLRKRELDIKYHGRIRDAEYPLDMGSLMASMLMLESWERAKITKEDLCEN